MQVSDLLKRLYHKDIAYIKTELGLTNTIYLADTDDGKIVIRWPDSKMGKLLDNNEREVLDLIKDTGLDVPEVYYDTSSRIRITKYIESKDFNATSDPQKDIKALGLIKKLHSYAFKVSHSFDSYKLFSSFVSNCINPLYEYKELSYIFDVYATINHPHILCHNDLVAGNFLFSEDKTYLIDYEYAAMNDPFFDLMSFISENDIVEKTRKDFIIKEYLGHTPSIQEEKELLITETMMDLLWCSWANMLYGQRKEAIYKDIAKRKMERFLQGVSKL